MSLTHLDRHMSGAHGEFRYLFELPGEPIRGEQDMCELIVRTKVATRPEPLCSASSPTAHASGRRAGNGGGVL
ncbi:hypothetical protein GCM10009634_44940 [Saccharothrix xinjiangensis]